MKFAAVIIALAAATVAVAGPVAREESSVVELNDIDTAAIDYLVRRGLFDESSLEARGLLSSILGGKKHHPGGDRPAAATAGKPRPTRRP